MFHPALFYFHIALLIAYSTTVAPLSVLSSLPIIYFRDENPLLMWASIAGAATGHILRRKRPTKRYLSLVAQLICAFVAYDGSLLLFNVGAAWCLPFLLCIDYFTSSWKVFKLKSLMTIPITIYLLLYVDDLALQLLGLPIHIIVVLVFNMNAFKTKNN